MGHDTKQESVGHDPRISAGGHAVVRVKSDDVENVECIDDRAYQSLDKRGSQEAIPADLGNYLTELQFRSVNHLEDFGWQLAFVRRPLFELPTVVLLSPEGTQYALLDEEGGLNLEPDIQVRSISEPHHVHESAF